MSVFLSYIRNLLLFMVFASFVSMLAPAEPYKKYIQLVLGLILLALAAQPLGRFLGGPPVDYSSLLNGYITAQSTASPGSYDGLEQGLVADALDTQLRQQISALARDQGLALADLQTTLSPDGTQLQDISITVDDAPIASASPTPAPLVQIQPVIIGAGSPLAPLYGAGTSANAADAGLEALKKNIADFYGLQEEHIHIQRLQK